MIRPALLSQLGARERERVIERFQREARTVAMLRCPHTVALYDFGVTDDGTLYHVLELLEGVDFETLVLRWGPIPPVRVAYLIGQVCESLAEAHDIGLVHRDIKPANLYVCGDRRQADVVKVLDFGLVRPIDIDESTTITVDHTLAGTPAYMAPEQIVDPRSVDARTDLYALGCVAYWLLTGQDVFTGRSHVEVLAHHMGTPPVPPSRITEEPISRHLDDIILRCLEKSPANRPSSAEALISMLAREVVGPPWTPKRARRWWETHDPEVGD
jgi:serine/threonine-protein kinase